MFGVVINILLISAVIGQILSALTGLIYSEQGIFNGFKGCEEDLSQVFALKHVIRNTASKVR